ncbi:unnamed protein product [Bemisia tabaci]|uniref:BEN domain-containing protein n=1 Tax=Bemisia tabaci TaxID=7038 RepID=A0A9P0C8E6_BEMTA|nr:unnamed protein product [Bemisia tabaci]
MVDLKKQQRSKGNASKKLSIQEPDSPYKSKAKKKEVIKQGTKSTNDDLLSKYKKKSKKNPSPNVSTDSDSSSSDIIERRELKDVQRRKDVLEKQNSTMRAELCELRSLNRKWQTKFFEIEEGDLSQPDKPTVVRSLISDFGDQSATPEKVSPGAERKLLPTNLVSKCFSSDLERIEYEEEEGEAEKLPSLHATPEKKTDEEQPSVETPVGNFQVVKSPVKIKPHSATTVSSCAFDVNPSASTSTVTASSKKASKEKKKKKVSLPALDEDPADVKLVQARIPLSPKKLAKAEYGIRGKAKGDSVYVRNLAMSIFSPEVLIRSSVTGTGCTAKEDSIPRPPLPQIGMEYLSACFDERAKKEIPAPDQDTLDMRRKQINQILAHKIKEERKKYFD